MRRKFAVAAVATMLLVGTARAQDEKPAAPSAPHPLEGLWELRMERNVWWPYLVPGSLAVSNGPQGLRASLTFDPMWGIDPKHVTVEPAAGDRVRFSVDLSPDDHEVVTGTVKDGVFVGEIDWSGAKPPEKCFISGERLASMRRFESDSTTGPFPFETDPTRVGVDPAALDRLILYAGRFDTDALVVIKDGRLICDRTFLRPRCLCATEAITQTVASLAVPLLVADGKIPRDLDTPLVTWFPDWKSDARKSRITLRQLLAHTSGLAASVAQSAMSDYLESSRACAAAAEPGARFAYSEQAMELLSGIVAQAVGEQADTYLAERVLRPLGITRSRWPRDGAGNVPTYGGLDLGARDLARIGWLIACRGKLEDKQIVPPWWFDEIAAPGAVNEEFGLTCALLRDPRTETVAQTQAKLDRLKEDGFADADRLKPMVGKSFESRRAWWKAAFDILGKDGIKQLYEKVPHPAVGGELRGPVSCVYQAGLTGQYLLVFPEQRLVVVRQRRGFAPKELPQETSVRAGFHDLPKLVLDLLR